MLQPPVHPGAMRFDDMAGAKLPELPRGTEFEEFVAGILQAGGNYIERKIIERDKVDILELDIISTAYVDDFPKVKLVEAKSGNWGTSDVFKLCGWMKYLDIPEGVLVTLKNRDHIDRIASRAKALSIDLQPLEDLSNAEKQLAPHVDGKPLIRSDVSIWRFSYWIERNLLDRLKQHQKSAGDTKRFDAMWNYYFELTSGIFFTPIIVSRLRTLYDLYSEYPHLSSRCAGEMSGEDFYGDHDKVPQELYEETFYKCVYNDLQISCYVEHMARLSILKSAVDFILYQKKGFMGKATKEWSIAGHKFDEFDWLPQSFREGLDEIKDDPYLHRYPVLWQWFMWFFGGFVLCDYEDQEIEQLAQRSRMPPEHVELGLAAYDKLFPTSQGWLIEPTDWSNIRLLQMFPIPFRGIGANVRRILYGPTQQYKELKLTKRYTGRDLIRWNNLAVEVLNAR